MPRPRSFDEDTVLDRAVELFWERGYEGTSVSDLETRLGVGRQSLYNAFGDKHALFLRALERYRQMGAERQVSVLMNRDAGLQAITTFFDRLVTGLAPRAGEPRNACFIANSVLELAGHCDDTRTRCASAERATAAAFRHALGNASRRGEVRRGLDLDSAATMLVTQMYGLSVMAKLGSSREQLRGAVGAMLAGLA